MIHSLINTPILLLPIFSDLQLAAELGKTLLERNKELENLLRAHQRKCEDQKQEIEVSLGFTSTPPASMIVFFFMFHE